MESNTPNPQVRRLFFIGALVMAVVLEPFCLGWYALLDSVGTPFGDFQGPTPLFFSATFIALLAGIIALVFGKSRWRWLLLLLILPCAYAFGDALLEACYVYARVHH